MWFIKLQVKIRLIRKSLHEKLLMSHINIKVHRHEEEQIEETRVMKGVVVKVKNKQECGLLEVNEES